MELVFEPDLRCAEQAAALVRELVLILRRIGTCSCRMEEGALRVDANVSVRPVGDPRLGVRSEVKNIGSVRGVARAVQFEVDRQVALRRAGQRVVNETRSYDPERGVTVAMRDKEVVQVRGRGIIGFSIGDSVNGWLVGDVHYQNVRKDAYRQSQRTFLVGSNLSLKAVLWNQILSLVNSSRPSLRPTDSISARLSPGLPFPAGAEPAAAASLQFRSAPARPSRRGPAEGDAAGTARGDPDTAQGEIRPLRRQHTGHCGERTRLNGERFHVDV